MQDLKRIAGSSGILTRDIAAWSLLGADPYCVPKFHALSFKVRSCRHPFADRSLYMGTRAREPASLKNARLSGRQSFLLRSGNFSSGISFHLTAALWLPIPSGG
jgi:hypothetical protein